MFRKKIQVLVWGAGQTDSGTQLQEPLGGSGSVGRGWGRVETPAGDGQGPLGTGGGGA